MGNIEHYWRENYNLMLGEKGMKTSHCALNWSSLVWRICARKLQFEDTLIYKQLGKQLS